MDPRDPLAGLLKALQGGRVKVIDGGEISITDLMRSTEKPIGKIPGDMLKQFKAIAHEDRVLHREMDAVSTRLQAEYERRAEEELDKFRDQHDDIQARKAELWDQIADYIGWQDREQPMTINPVTGVVSAVLGADGKPKSDGSHLRVVPFDKKPEDELH